MNIMRTCVSGDNAGSTAGGTMYTEGSTRKAANEFESGMSCLITSYVKSFTCSHASSIRY